MSPPWPDQEEFGHEGDGGADVTREFDERSLDSDAPEFPVEVGVPEFALSENPVDSIVCPAPRPEPRPEVTDDELLPGGTAAVVVVVVVSATTVLAEEGLPLEETVAVFAVVVVSAATALAEEELPLEETVGVVVVVVAPVATALAEYVVNPGRSGVVTMTDDAPVDASEGDVEPESSAGFEDPLPRAAPLPSAPLLLWAPLFPWLPPLP